MYRDLTGDQSFYLILDAVSLAYFICSSIATAFYEPAQTTLIALTPLNFRNVVEKPGTITSMQSLLVSFLLPVFQIDTSQDEHGCEHTWDSTATASPEIGLHMNFNLHEPAFQSLNV